MIFRGGIYCMDDKISCEIVRDLLSGYTENILSVEGTRLVKEHIDNCECCRKEYEILNASFNIDNESKEIKDKFNYLKKINLRFLITVIILLLITVISNVVYIIYSSSDIGEGLFALLLIGLICGDIIVAYLIPLFGFVYGIVYFKNKHKKRYIIPIIICGAWLGFNLYTYIERYCIVQTFSLF